MLGKGKKKNTNDEHVEEEPEQPNKEEQQQQQTSGEAKEGFFGKVKRKTGNAGKVSSLAAYKTKKQTQNSMLKSKQKTRKEKFGVEYIDLILAKTASKQELQACKDQAQADLKELQTEIDRNVEKMEHREEEVHEKIILDSGEHSTPPAKAPVEERKPKAKPFWKQGNSRKEPPGKNPNKQYYPEPEGLAGRRK